MGRKSWSTTIDEDLQDNPRPRRYDVVAGRPNQLRARAGRDHRILDEPDEADQKIVIVAVREKDEATCR